MEFNKLIFDKFDPVLKRYNLEATEQWKNYVKFKSEKVIVVFAYNERENSASFYAGEEEKYLYPINNNIALSVFNFNLKINEVSPEIFITNLELFFEGEGRSILKGDIAILRAVEKCIYKESQEYTGQFMEKQNLDNANKAWAEGDYKEFIKYIDKMDRQKLPSSYELKYKIANQKIKN